MSSAFIQSLKHHKFRPTRPGAALLVGVILFGIVLGTYFWNTADKYYKRTPRRVGRPIYGRDETLGYTLLPNVIVKNPGKSEYTDARGIRVNTPKTETPPQVDVLVAGCSFSYGLGVEQAKSFSGLLDQELSGDRVANIGVSGYGTVSSRLRSMQYLDLKPKIIVYGYIEDHLRRNISPCAADGRVFCRPMPHMISDHHGSWIQTFPSQFVSWQNFAHTREIELDHELDWNDVKWAILRTLAPITGSDSFSLNETTTRQIPDGIQPEVTAKVLTDWWNALSAQGIDLIVVYIPDLGHPEPMTAPSRSALLPLVGKPGFTLVDTAPALARHPHNLCVSPGDCHPSAAAHRIIASELAPIVRKILKRH